MAHSPSLLACSATASHTSCLLCRSKNIFVLSQAHQSSQCWAKWIFHTSPLLPPTVFLNIHFTFILTPTPDFSSWALCFILWDNMRMILPFISYVLHDLFVTFFSNHSNKFWWRKCWNSLLYIFYRPSYHFLQLMSKCYPIVLFSKFRILIEICSRCR
jgi:hypothetical protein